MSDWSPKSWRFWWVGVSWGLAFIGGLTVNLWLVLAGVTLPIIGMLVDGYGWFR